MFYSTEILTERKYGVATVWLVATLGPKSRHMRVQRKDILSVDVPKACGTISNPEVPFALRLQSSLLYGVTKCFSQQYHYFLQDVTNVHTNVRRTYSSSASNPELVNLAVGATKSRENQFVLADDPSFLPDINFAGLDDILDFNIGVLRLDESQILASADATETPPMLGSRNSRRSPMYHPPSRIGQGSNSSGVDASPMMDFELSNEELPEALDFEFGGDGDAVDVDPVQVRDMLSTPVPQRKTVKAGMKQGRERLRSDSLAIDQVENDHEGAINRKLNLGERDDIQDIYDDPMDLDAELHTAHGQALLAQDDSMISLEEDVPAIDVGENEAAPASKTRKRGPRNNFIFDENTQLKWSNLSYWKENYLDMMDDVKKKKKVSKDKTAAKVNAQKIILQWGIGGQIINPVLQAAFSGNAILEKLRISKDGMEIVAGKKRSIQDEEEEARRVRAKTDDGDFHGGDGNEFEKALQRHDDDTVEVARHAIDESSAMGEESRASIMPWDMFSAKGSQIGRGGSQVGAQFSGMSSSEIGGEGMSAGVYAMRGARVDAGPVPSRGRRISASPLMDRGRISVLEEESWESGQFGTDDEDRYLGAPVGSSSSGNVGYQDSFEFFGPAAKVDTQLAETDEFLTAQLENEARNFLSFVKAKAGEKAEAGGPGMITFTELIPPARNTNIVAAQAFLQTLTLARMGLVMVKQEQVFDGEIRILVKE